MDKDISNTYDFLEWGDLKIFSTHGHKESENTRFFKALELGANVIVTGHTHIKVLENKDGMVFLNPGSPSLPKDGIRSVAKYEGGEFSLIDVESEEVISKLQIK
ncbi:MAG: metallophosphoesterase family protein, partial [Gallicola sp.]|nr:metallophosphoesterase family protein [Gallicola sp.]